VLHRMKYPWLWNERLYRLLPVGREDTACLKELHGFTKEVRKGMCLTFEYAFRVFDNILA
jgi:hypothetical protein